jgi:hypothetical protein
MRTATTLPWSQDAFQRLLETRKCSNGRIYALYREGYNDAQIAQRIGFKSAATVRRYRVAQDDVYNGIFCRRSQLLREQLLQDATQLMTDEQIVWVRTGVA